MEELSFKKNPNRVIKSFGLTPEGVDKLKVLSDRFGIPKSKVVNDLILYAEPDIFDHNFVLAIKAECKGRPRFGKQGVYTDDKTRMYETRVNQSISTWWAKPPLKGAIRCSLAFQFKQPKKAAHGYPSAKDLDNLVKAWLDSANGVVFKDDRQVIEIRASKVFGVDDRVKFAFSEE